jgi:hypothetical protein
LAKAELKGDLWLVARRLEDSVLQEWAVWWDLIRPAGAPGLFTGIVGHGLSQVDWIGIALALLSQEEGGVMDAPPPQTSSDDSDRAPYRQDDQN